MGMRVGWGIGALVAAGLAIGAASAQTEEEERPGRPGILAATGLLQTETLELPETGEAPGLTMEIPTSPQVQASATRDNDDPSFIAAIQFRTETGRIVESIVLTHAALTTGDAEERRFALANILVLRSFPALARQSEDAQLLLFGPVPGFSAIAPEDPQAPARPDAVQSLGTFTGAGGEALFFRHVGMVVPGREKAVIALITSDTCLMPVGGLADLADSYSGRTLDSLRFLPEPAGVEGEPVPQE